MAKGLVSRRTLAVLVLIVASASPAAARIWPSAAGSVPAQPAECCAPTGADVPKVGGDLGDQDYSSLAQITPANVHRLAGAWTDPLTGATTDKPQESTPVAVGGDLYLQTGDGDVLAVNGATGKIIWDYHSGLPGTERGVAVAGGTVFSALGGEQVVALSQRTGSVRWKTRVGTAGQDTAANGARTPWVLYYRGLVLTGTENGGGAGMRGHLYALHAATGKVAWSFATTAAPGQPGGGSWAGGSWKLGGGDAWMAPAIDPKLGLIYLAAANPQPQGQGAARAGADLYTSSLVAVHWNTGRLAWYFQSVHHDLWDYDNTMSPVIADETYGGKVRKVVIYGSKTGWLYYLDAGTGKPVIPVHEEPVPQLAAQDTAAAQPIPAGQSLVPTCPQSAGLTQPVPDYAIGCEFTPYRDQPVLVTPGWGGGADWSPMSFDQSTGLLYVAAAEANTAYSTGQPYGQPTTWEPEGERRGGLLDAVNPATGTVAWHVATADELSYGEGIETTASGLLFEGTPDGLLVVRRASTGARLWQWQTGAGISSTPVTYLARGVQYVAVLAGQRAAPFRLWAFRLGGTVPQAAPPATVPVRVPVHGAVVAGDTVADTVVLGRTWDAATHAPGPHENLASPTAMAPEIMTVPAGTTVTFENPAGNHQDHCAESFFDPASFKIGPIEPGTSGSYQFAKPGDYFYNDCAGFPWNTGEIIVT